MEAGISRGQRIAADACVKKGKNNAAAQAKYITDSCLIAHLPMHEFSEKQQNPPPHGSKRLLQQYDKWPRKDRNIAGV